MSRPGLSRITAVLALVVAVLGAVAALAAPDGEAPTAPVVTEAPATTASTVATSQPTADATAQTTQRPATNAPTTSTTVPPPTVLGGAIVFWRVDQGAAALEAMSPDGAAVERFAERLAHGRFAFSPDQTQLVTFEPVPFERDDGEQLRSWELFLRRADGSSPRQLTTPDGHAHEDGDLSWTPDGTEITTIRGGQLVNVSAADGHVTPLTENRTSAVSSWDWHPSGDRLAYIAGGSLRIHDVRAGTDTEVLPSDRQAASVTWSSDGAWAAVVEHDRAASEDIVTIRDAATLDVRSRVEHASRFAAPVWSPTAPTLLAAQLHPDTGQQVVVAAIDGTIRTIAPTQPVHIEELIWSPDGRGLAFERDLPDGPPLECCGRPPQQGYRYEIAVFNLETNELRHNPLPDTTTVLASLAWIS